MLKERGLTLLRITCRHRSRHSRETQEVDGTIPLTGDTTRKEEVQFQSPLIKQREIEFRRRWGPELIGRSEKSEPGAKALDSFFHFTGVL
jgi:hypothetical protein